MRYAALTIAYMVSLAPASLSGQSLPSIDSALTLELPGEACSESFEPIIPVETPREPKVQSVVPKRLFGVIPNYRADQFTEVYKPLTTKEKFNIARSDSFDWPNYFLLAGYAIQSQVAAGGFGHNGGLKGFGEYYARSVGDQIIGSYVTEAMLPSLLHEDPRFFRKGTGSLLGRAIYASSRVLITRKDNGRNAFNLSEVFGNAGVVALTTVYYSDSRTAGEGLERLGMAIGNDAISNLLTEFWPDVKRHLPWFH